MPTKAILYDGVTAHRHAVTVEAMNDAIRLATADGWSETVDAALLTLLDGDKTAHRIGRGDRPGWRLMIPPDAGPALLSLLPKPARYGRWIDRIGLGPALAAGAAITAAVVLIGYAAPAWLAPLIPPRWERDLGTAIVGDFGDNRCRNPQGERALVALAERLSPGSTSGPDQIKLAAIDFDMFNAAALPGGHIVIFKGAITETRDTDELAGIVAHEIAHVRRRHVTQALIRELGVGALIRLFAGNVGANANTLVSLSYTRANEAEADRDAIAMLTRAGISPLPTARVFARLAKEEGGGSSFGAAFLDSHPATAGRARRFAAAHVKGRTYRTALSQQQSDALFNVCWQGKRDGAPSRASATGPKSGRTE